MLTAVEVLTGIFVVLALLVPVLLAGSSRRTRLPRPPSHDQITGAFGGEDAFGGEEQGQAVGVLAPPEPEPVVIPQEMPAPRQRFRERLSRSRTALSRGLAGLLTRGVDDDEAWDELEEALIAADLGVRTVGTLLAAVRSEARAQASGGAEQLREILRAQLLSLLSGMDRTLALDLLEPAQRPGIVLMVGVNGTGKTTTVGKLALALAEEGKHVVLGAADTFRAAASEQLVLWGERAGASVVAKAQGADPASVAFDALVAARTEGADVVLIDTAGRLHTKANLMEELKKIRRILEREGGSIREVLLVLDATTGQNGLVQARQFMDAVGVTGVVLTKLDGTARGGIVIAVEQDLGIPVKLVGLGEGAHDLAPFEPEAFVDALLAPVEAV